MKKKIGPRTSDAAVVHSNQASALHAKHKLAQDAKAAKSVKSEKVTVSPLPGKPVANLRPWYHPVFNEQQVAMIREIGTRSIRDSAFCFIPVMGETFQKFLEAEREKRPKRRVKNGMRNGKQRFRLLANLSRTVLETITFTPWHSELLREHAEIADRESLITTVAKRYEVVTGRIVVALSLHCDTAKYHVDIHSTDRDEDANPLDVKFGAWQCSTGLAVDLRMAREGYPVEKSKLASERESFDAAYQRPGFSSHRNYEAGVAGDDWIFAWAERRGLTQERLERMRRFAEYELKKQARIRALENAEKDLEQAQATVNSLEKQLQEAGHTSSANKAELKAGKALAAELAKSVSELRRSFDVEAQRSSDLEAQLDSQKNSATERIEKIKSEASAQVAEAAKLRNEIGVRDEELKRLKEELEMAKAQVEAEKAKRAEFLAKTKTKLKVDLDAKKRTDGGPQK